MHHFNFFSFFCRSPKWLPLIIMLPKPRSMWLEVPAWPARSDLWPQWPSKIWPVQLEITKLVIGFLKMVKFVARRLQNLIIWLFICECMKMFVPLVVVFAIKHLGMLFIQKGTSIFLLSSLLGKEKTKLWHIFFQAKSTFAKAWNYSWCWG